MADNTFVNIGGHKISAGKVYSTSEVRTGDVWIDGKPIYRKVLTSSGVRTFSLSNKRNISTNATIYQNTNVDTVITNKTIAKWWTTTSLQFTGNLLSGLSDMTIAGYFGLTYNYTTKYFEEAIEYNSGYFLDPSKSIECIHIVEYTKTTD